MNKYFKILTILAAAGLIIFIIVYKYVYNKPHTDYEKAETEFVLEAEQLYNEFVSDFDKASIKYNGKVVQISGNIGSIERVGELVIAFFIYSEGMFGHEGVRCSMLHEHGEKLMKLEVNSSIVIKGLCTGFTETDVILESCSVIDK